MDWRQTRDELLMQLEREKKLELRALAAEQLCTLAQEHAEEAEEWAAPLPRLLEDPLDVVRRAALRIGALVLDLDEAQQLFISRLKDASELVRLEATGQLADLMSPTARGALAAMLEDKNLRVRFEAARGMAQLQHAAGIDVLIEALDNADLRFRALGSLALLSDPRALPALRRIFERWLLPAFDRTQAAGALAKLGDEAGHAHLLARAKKRWSADRALAVELTGEVRTPGALEQLTAIVQDPNDLCRGAAARGLGRLGDPKALLPLEALLQEADVDDDLRLDAAEGLCLLGGEVARQRAAAAREKLTSPAARDELDELLEAYR